MGPMSGVRRVGTHKVGGPTFCVFSLSRPSSVFFFPLSGVCSWNLCGVLVVVFDNLLEDSVFERRPQDKAT